MSNRGSNQYPYPMSDSSVVSEADSRRGGQQPFHPGMRGNNQYPPHPPHPMRNTSVVSETDSRRSGPRNSNQYPHPMRNTSMTSDTDNRRSGPRTSNQYGYPMGDTSVVSEADSRRSGQRSSSQYPYPMADTSVISEADSKKSTTRTSNPYPYPMTDASYSDDESAKVVVERPANHRICGLAVLSLLHIGFGIGCMAMNICYMVSKRSGTHRYVATGVIGGLFFIITGVIGIVSILPFSFRCLKVFLVMTVISATLTAMVVGGAMTCMIMDDIHLKTNPDRKKWNLFNGMLLMFGLLELLIGFITMCVCWRIGVPCCGKPCCVPDPEDDTD